VRSLAIEINDAGIAVADSTGLLAIEPGYAVVERDRILTGREAVAKARLKPRQSSNRFWNALSTEPGSAGSEIPNSAAELAFTQLEGLWKRYGAEGTDAVLVVPGQYRGEQLGLVLGLAHECGIPVRALLDTAAAASVRPYPDHQLLYVDAGLYRLAVTLVEQGNEVIVQSEQSLITTGLASLNEAFARRAAETFVRATRFDPLHRAETEQALYDRLPHWLEQLREQPHVELALTYQGEEIKAVLERASILGVVAGFQRALVQLIAYYRQAGQRVAILVADRLATLPGLGAHLSRLDDVHVEALPPGHAAIGALLKPELIPASGGQVKLLKRFAWRAPPAEVAQAASVAVQTAPGPPRNAATHVVYAGVVYPVGARGIVVGRELVEGRRTIVVADQANGVSRAHCELVLRDGELKLRDLSRYGTFVNEKKISGETTLERADVIRIGSPGAELQVVSIEDGETA
jgi:hypothetical protein